jgi:hypothetical protein
MSRERYFDKLRFLESELPVAVRPSIKALRKWRAGRPEDSALSLAVPHTIDPIYLRDAVAATGAEVVTFRTPADLSPSASNRALLAARLRDSAGLAAAIAWQPAGLWELDAAAALARDAGALLVIDPLATDPLREQSEILDDAFAAGEAYFRPSGLGSGRTRFRETDLDDLALRLGELRRGWVALANPDRMKDARPLAQRLELKLAQK